MGERMKLDGTLEDKLRADFARYLDDYKKLQKEVFSADDPVKASRKVSIAYGRVRGFVDAIRVISGFSALWKEFDDAVFRVTV